jgi:hypothetical protein
MKKINLILLFICMLFIGRVSAQNYFAGGAGTGNTGAGNVGLGPNNQDAGTSGSLNTSVGNFSLFFLTSGNYNSALGDASLLSVTTGTNNTGIGVYAGGSIKTGSNNTAIGFYALPQSTASSNDAFGYQSLFKNTTGTNNVGIGVQALYSNTTGNYNTAVGQLALYNNSSGPGNTVVGYQAAYKSNVTDGSNDIFGYQSLYNNTTGKFNVGMGYQTMYTNISGSDNTALGYKALYTNGAGHDNVAVGYEALYSCTGVYNIGIGDGALYTNTYANYNVGIGNAALYLNVTGQDNTAVGDAALTNSLGGDNTALGFNAGTNNTYSQCTFLGSLADAENNCNNGIAIGYKATVTAPYTIQLGNPLNTFTGSFGSTAMMSDGRFKKDIKENVPGLAFIKSLRPVTYHFNIHPLDKFLYGDKADKFEKENIRGVEEKEKIQYTGFIAQEVEASAKKLGYNFSGVKTPQNDKDIYGLAYAEFVVPLVKGMQEQQGIIESQADTIKTMQSTLNNVLARMEIMSSQLSDIKECCSSNQGSSLGSLLNGPQLLNAVPNPTSGATVIYYYIPSTAKTASLQLTDANGQAIQTIAIANFGYSSSPLQISNLTSSIYYYTLIVDDKNIGTKPLNVVLK